MTRPVRSLSDLSLESLRRDHAPKYRRWVLIGLSVSLIGYATSCLTFTLQRSFAASVASGDPFVVAANLVAFTLLYSGRPRGAACLSLGAAFVDVHFSMFVLQMPTLGNVGLVVPAFVLTGGILLGGYFALAVAGLLAFSVPATLWLAARMHPGTGLDDPAVVHYIVVLEVVLIATTALVLVLLRTAAEILEQYREGEARSLALQAQLQHSQKLEALGLLAGGVAHDFNNLLTVIGGYGVLLGRSSDTRARELGNEVIAAQRRGATLTRQLLAFARKDTPQPRPIDLSHSLAELTELLRRAIGGRVELHVDAEPECPILADPGRIEQVVVNLAMNASDAMPNGGKLSIRCAKDGQRVRLEVEDEGVGIDEATQARIFEPFFTTKGRHRGTGLGLSTVHGIVAESGGSIELHSKLGHGTCFTLHWPRVTLGPVEKPADAIELLGAGRCVLWVEDNERARDYVRGVLEERGFFVISACSAEQAIELTAPLRDPPALVLTDVILPSLTGPELVAQLKQRWPSVRCLFVSGYLGDIALGDGFDPAHDLVFKPFMLQELLSRIATKLG